MASRDLNDLLPHVREAAEELIRRCAARGIRLGISATYRTPAEQMALWMQGRFPLAEVNRKRASVDLPVITEKENRRKVTWAKTGESWHEFRRAFDVFVLRDVDGDGDLDADWESPHWQTIGEQGERCGLEWGGRFGRPDYPHFQMTDGLTIDVAGLEFR